MKQPIKFEITTCEEKNAKIKLQMNEYETYKTIHNLKLYSLSLQLEKKFNKKTKSIISR